MVGQEAGICEGSWQFWCSFGVAQKEPQFHSIDLKKVSLVALATLLYLDSTQPNDLLLNSTP
jgi:hypothetical protein